VFSKKKQVFREFDRKSYTKRFGELIGNEVVYDKLQGREINYKTNSETEMTLSTDWTEQEVISWLVQELLESPLVILNGKRYTITNARMEEPQERYETLSQLTITMKSSLKSNGILA
jgi:hypothetical protein